MTRVSRFLQLENGWLVPTMLLILIILPVFSFNDAAWVDRTEQLFPVTLVAALTGMAMGRSRLHRFIAVPLGLLIVAGVLYLWLGEVLPPVGVIQYRLYTLPAFLSGQETFGNPLQRLGQEIIDRNSLMIGRLYDWLVVGTEGGYSSDNFVFFFLLALLTGALSFFTVWSIYRYRNALFAVLPVGIVLMLNSFLSNRGILWIFIYVLVTLILLMATNLASMQRKWQSKDIDYSTEMNLDLTVFTVQVSAVLAIVAFLLPSLRANPVASTWWIYASGPWGNVETLVNRMFAGVNNPNPDLGTGSKGALVLGGSFERSDSSPAYMYIHTNEYIPDPAEAERMGEPDLGPPQHYWRGETWDLYTGHGWDHSQKVALDRTASEPVSTYEIPGAITIVQNIDIVAPRADLLYATNQAQAVGQSYRYMGLGPEDFSTLFLKRAPLVATQYQVTSTIPYVGKTDLRRSSTEYPEWVQQYYLQLPKSLPERVTELAKELTAKAANPYDKAIAIQDYLRELPYDSSIQLPTSGNFDAVDYFLFTQKGYCDYFGTVMAIMLRTVGVPARLATGYLPGTYDYGKQRFEVDERDGHAWTEAYFAPYGWIEFEATPANPPIVRPEGSLFSSEPYVSQTVTVQTTSGGILGFLSNIKINVNFLRFAPVFVALALALGLLWVLWPLMERRLATSNFIVTIYGRMCRYAAWAGLAKPMAQTPYEYSRHLSDAVSQNAAGGSRWSRPAAGDQAQHIATISDAFVQTRYSQHPPTAETRASVIRSWQAVKGRLWSMMARSTLNRVFRRSP